MELDLYRHTYNTTGDRSVIGDLFTSGTYFCHTLEDELRAEGVKVYGETCIDAGRYEIKVTYSPKFKRQMIAILRVPNFTGIRIHGGNRAKDTLGCPLVAYNTDGHKIWGTAEKALTKMVKAAKGKSYITIHNSFLSYDKENKKVI